MKIIDGIKVELMEPNPVQLPQNADAAKEVAPAVKETADDVR